MLLAWIDWDTVRELSWWVSDDGDEPLHADKFKAVNIRKMYFLVIVTLHK